jgi:hypothetical protein
MQLKRGLVALGATAVVAASGTPTTHMSQAYR